MSNGKIKITCGDLVFELEADNELLYRSFSDLRLDGGFSNNISSVKSRISAISETIRAEQKDSATMSECENEHQSVEVPSSHPAADLPDFNSLILERRSFSTSNWMLFMAWSVSHKGKIRFTKKQIHKIYCNSCKHIGLRSKDFISNFMLLLLNDYIVMVDKNTYELSETGYDKVHSVLGDSKEPDLLSQAI